MDVIVYKWEVKDVADEETRAKWRKYTNKYNAKHREQVNAKKHDINMRYIQKQLATNEEEFRRKQRESQEKFNAKFDTPEKKAARRAYNRERLRAWRAKKRAEKAALAALKAEGRVPDGPDD